MSVSWEALAEDPWFDFLADRVRAADPATRRGGITGLDRLIAIEELRHYLKEISDGERSSDGERPENPAAER